MRRAPVGILVVVLMVGCSTTLTRSELAVEYYNLGTAYFDLNDLGKSSDYLARALDLDPDLARASYNLARVYLIQGDYERSIGLLESLLGDDPENVLVLETLAYANYLTGEIANAAAVYDRAIELNPVDTDLLRNRSRVAVELSDYALAASLTREAFDLQPDNTQILLDLARILVTANDNEAALAAYKEYVIAAPDDGVGRSEYADLLFSLDFYSQGLDEYARITGDAQADTSLRILAHYRRAAILLTAAQESLDGLAELQAAISLGFADFEAVQLLLADDTLVSRGEVERMVADAGLMLVEAEPDSSANDEGATGSLPAAPPE